MTPKPPPARPATQRLTPAAWLAESDSSRLLGALAWGAATGTDPFAVPLTVLENSAATDVWWSADPVLRGCTGNVAWRLGGGLCFGAIDVPGAGRRDAPMSVLAWQAYTKLFTALRGSGHGKLLRVWNVLPQINEETGGSPGEPVDNPRQVAAGAYPATCGPKAPSFSRAMLVDAGGGRRGLLVSGTASIVGHQSVHADVVAAQTEETLENLHAVLARARGAACPAVAQAVFVRADIIRRELLVAIEGHLRPGAA